MDCFHDFCLGCDRGSPDGPYCSQSCRLADLERARTVRTPTPPNAPSTPRQRETSPESGTGTGYILAPAYKFPERAAGPSQTTTAEVRRSSSSHLPLRSPRRRPQVQSTEQQRTLTPSSSRSSLSSTRSSMNSNSISDQAMKELQEYFRSFDQARAAKRRQSMC